MFVVIEEEHYCCCNYEFKIIGSFNTEKEAEEYKSLVGKKNQREIFYGCFIEEVNNVEVELEKTYYFLVDLEYELKNTKSVIGVYLTHSDALKFKTNEEDFTIIPYIKSKV